jgi:6-phosphofructokinase 1
MKDRKRIGILTGGGDCPGINAVIRAVAKKAIHDYDMEIVGIEDGYEGLVHGRSRKLDNRDVSGILTLGGTILGTTKKVNPYRYAIKKDGDFIYKDMSKQAVRFAKSLGLDCLVVIGGDGTLGIAYKLFKDGIPVVGVPKTIDNDILGTDRTFGFDTATWIATEGIDRLHTTAQSHHRVMVVEVMGHNAGWLALASGIAGGGDIILIPEMPYKMGRIVEKVRERNRKGKRFSIVVAAEGARPEGGEAVVQRIVKESSDPIRLGGIGFVLGDQIEKATGIETRAVVMGHLQRGGSPTPFDRILATELGSKAIDMIIAGKFGYMAGVHKGDYVEVSLKDVAKGHRTVPVKSNYITTAMSLGTSFGI